MNSTTLDEPSILDALAEARRLHADALWDDNWQLARVYDNRARKLEDALRYLRAASARIEQLAGC